MDNLDLKTYLSVTVESCFSRDRHVYSPVMAMAGLCCLAMIGMGQMAQAAPVLPPPAGAIQKQMETPTALPAPPGKVINLPEPTRQKSSSRLKIPVRLVQIHGNTLLPEKKLHALVKEIEGKSLPLGEIQSLVGRITEAYHRAGYPLAFAYLSAQKIRNGVVTVTVIEPRYDKVKVVGKSRLKTTMTKHTVGVKPGELIDEHTLTRGLILLNQTPGVNVHAVLSPGTRSQTSILQLNLRDTPILSGNVFVNNSGNRYVGSTLIGADGFLSNPFGYGSSLNVNAMTSPGGAARLSAGGFTFNSPDILNGLRVGIYGSTTSYHLGGSFSALDEFGRAKQAGVDTTYPLLLAPGKQLIARMDILKNWLSQTTTASSTTSNQAITIERLSLSGSYVDMHSGINQVNVSVSHGQLSITPASAQAVDTAGSQTAGSFAVVVLQLSRLQALPHEFDLLAGISGQWANKNLDSSQKFYLGGPHGVKGYEVGDGGGDEGYLLDLELSHPLHIASLPGHLSGALFTQAGKVRVNHTIYTGFAGRNTLREASAGVKITYGWKSLDLIASYGQRVGPYASSGAASDNSGQFWFSVNNQF